jgi:hypothetical protein
VKVVNRPLDGARVVDVEWDGEAVLMFTIDLRERKTLVPAARHIGLETT